MRYPYADAPLPSSTEYVGSPTFKLRLPRCDLIGVDVELLRKLHQR